jgi:hypothetical protein
MVGQMRENKSTHTPTHTAVWELQNAEMFDFPKGAIFSVLDIKYCRHTFMPDTQFRHRRDGRERTAKEIWAGKV